jgi:hypothetical protein
MTVDINDIVIEISEDKILRSLTHRYVGRLFHFRGETKLYKIVTVYRDMEIFFILGIVPTEREKNNESDFQEISAEAMKYFHVPITFNIENPTLYK